MTSKDPKTISEELKDMFEEKDTSGQSEALRQMYSSKDIKMKSDVNKKQGEAEYFAKLIILSKVLQVPEFNLYANEVLMVRVSNDRQSRREAVQMIQQVQPEQKRGLFGGIFR